MNTAPAGFYSFPWELETNRATIECIHFYVNMGCSDEFNHCFTERLIWGTNYVNMLDELGELGFLTALKHARNSSNGNVDFNCTSRNDFPSNINRFQ